LTSIVSRYNFARIAVKLRNITEHSGEGRRFFRMKHVPGREDEKRYFINRFEMQIYSSFKKLNSNCSAGPFEEKRYAETNYIAVALDDDSAHGLRPG
jgi:hypothetical protein